MEKVYPNVYYMTIYEKLKMKDGTESYYNRLMFNPSKWSIGDMLYTKKDLKEKVEQELTHVVELRDFTVTETAHGWNYERFIKWTDEDKGIYELVEEGQHTDHEVYTVDISYYEDLTDVFKYLR